MAEQLPTSIVGLRVKRLIARGGFAAVYLVEDAQGGQLAVKQLLPERRRIKSVVRGFEKEAEFLISKHLPGVVEALHYDRREAALVMEYLDGLTMEQVIRGALNELAMHTRSLIAIELCDVLEKLHVLSELHMDLKPDNVMLCRDGRVVLTDFGVGASVSARGNGTGPVMGAINYMAPEVLLQSEVADSRADIYSLGVMLYEFYRGAKAYHIEKGTMLREALEKVRPLDSVESLTVPIGVAMTIQRAMAFNRRNRWRSAGEMASMLRREVPELSEEEIRGDVAAAMKRVRVAGVGVVPIETTTADPTDPELLAGTASASRRRSGGAMGWIVGAVVVLALAVGGIFAAMNMRDKPRGSRTDRPLPTRPPVTARPTAGAGGVAEATPTAAPALPTVTPVPPTATPAEEQAPEAVGTLKLVCVPKATVVRLQRVMDARSYLSRLGAGATCPTSIEGLPVGTYRVTVEVAGTDKAETRNVVVEEGTAARERFNLRGP